MGLLPGAPTRICQQSVVILLKTGQVAHVGVNAALSPGKPAAGGYAPASPTESCEHRPGAGSVRGRLAGLRDTWCWPHVPLTLRPGKTSAPRETVSFLPFARQRDPHNRPSAQRPDQEEARLPSFSSASCCFRPISSHSSLLSSLVTLSGF